jgi:hypothetical protein
MWKIYHFQHYSPRELATQPTLESLITVAEASHKVFCLKSQELGAKNRPPSASFKAQHK